MLFVWKAENPLKADNELICKKVVYYTNMALPRKNAQKINERRVIERRVGVNKIKNNVKGEKTWQKEKVKT